MPAPLIDGRSLGKSIRLAAAIVIAVSNITAHASTDDTQTLWMAVRLNGVPTSTPALVLRDTGGHLWLRADDAQQWRVRVDAGAKRTQDGDTFLEITSAFHIDEATQTLDLDLPSNAFEAHRESLRDDRRLPVSAVAAGAFVNYDISTQRVGNVSQDGGLFEIGAFTAQGVLTSNAIARDFGTVRGVERLDTVWTQDHPDQLATLRIGDSVSSSPDWSRSVRFAGVQWATDFATQPGFVPFPLPTFSGEAVVPSTVDLYVDNALRLSRDVPAGPFTFVDVPVVSGAGQAHIVVRDMLGREQAVSLPYYTTPRLLQSGLDDVSYEAGFVRNQYGIESFDYGRFIASATQRHGFSDVFTGDAHMEVSGDRQAAGIGGTLLVAPVGVFNASVAASRSSDTGAGALMQLGFEHQGDRISVGGDVKASTRDFTALGYTANLPVPRWSAHGYANYSLGDAGSLGANVTDERFRNAPSVRLIGASYSRNIGRLGFLSLSALWSGAARSGTTLMFTFTRPIGHDGSASLSGIHDAHTTQLVADVQRNVPAGTGFGYHVEAAAGDGSHGDAMLTFQNNVGTYTVEATRNDDITGVRAEVTGGFAWFGGLPHAARRLDDSFALVQIPGFANVGVYVDNQKAATTDANGNALIPRMRAYEANPVSIDTADLPLDTTIETTELTVVPAYRSAARAVFPVRHAQGGMAALVRGDGSFIPAGARVRVNGTDAVLPVGLNGQLYLTGLARDNRIDVRWGEHACRADIAFTPTSDPQPKLGTFTCAETAR
jgi:outer membrane usher protein